MTVGSHNPTAPAQDSCGSSGLEAGAAYSRSPGVVHPEWPLSSSCHRASILTRRRSCLRVVEACRPHSILPFHHEPHVDDLTVLLQREPEDLSVEVMDYLQWRGINVDIEVRRLIRKTIDLSSELRSHHGARSIPLPLQAGSWTALPDQRPARTLALAPFRSGVTCRPEAPEFGRNPGRGR